MVFLMVFISHGVCFSPHSGEHGEGAGGEGEPIQVRVCHPTELARQERAQPGDVQAQGMLWLPMRALAPSGRAAQRVDNVNKMHFGKDSVGWEYPEWFAWKVAVIAQC